MSSESNTFKCKKCDQTFSHELHFFAHKNSKIPCDYVCEYCDAILSCKRSYRRHLQSCKIYQKKPKKDDVEDDVPKISNEMNDNSITNSVNSPSTNTNNVGRDVNNNNNNQAIMMNPFGVEHFTMKKEVNMGHLRPKMRKFLRECDFAGAYDTIYTNVHGDPEKPENHNHLLEFIDASHVIVLRGEKFRLVPVEEFSGDIYSYLRYEIDWLAKTDPLLTEQEKSQLRWDLIANWMSTDIDHEKSLRLIIHKNKDIVLNTFKNRQVYMNQENVAKFKKIKVDSLKTTGKPIEIDFMLTNPINHE
jgi:hypothetical protein